MNIVEHLIGALKLAKAQESITKDATLAHAIGALINQRFPGNELEVQAIIQGRTVEVVSDKAPIGMRNWQPGKHTTPAASTVEPQDVVGDDEDEIDLDLISSLNAQQLLDHFKTIPLMKEFAKNLGFDVDHSLEGFDFVESFQEEIILRASDNLAEEE